MYRVTNVKTGREFEVSGADEANFWAFFGEKHYLVKRLHKKGAAR